MMTFLLLTAVVVLILVNGFFVAAEFALVRTRPAQLEEQAKAGSKTAALALRQTEDMSAYLSACQFGITLASLGIGFLGELVDLAAARSHEGELGGDEEPVEEHEQQQQQDQDDAHRRTPATKQSL